MARKGLSPRLRASLEPPGAEDGDDMADFERAEPMVVRHCRDAIVRIIKLHNQDGDPMRLAGVVIGGLFCDMLVAMRQHGELLDAINGGLVEAGYMLVPLPRN